MNGMQIRHDIGGWYVCTDQEAEDEDEGYPCVGLDGRDHWPTPQLAIEAMREMATVA